MPIYAGNSGSSKILGMTKTSDDQWNLKSDTIFHSILPYVRVIEHEFTSYVNVQDKLWAQDPSSGYWDQNLYGHSRWWCGQYFQFSQQLINSLQNTNRGFMVFIRWNDGWWEPLPYTGMEHEALYTWDNSNNFSYQQNLDVFNYYRNNYGLSRYSTGIFIPRRRVNGQNSFDPNAYVTNVRVLELVGLDVYSDASVGLSWQNPNQDNAIYIDNTQFIIGGVNIMQEKYLALMTNVTVLGQGSKAHNVQQDMVYPSSISYTSTNMDVVSQDRQNNYGYTIPRNSPPIVLSINVTGYPTWNVQDPLNAALDVTSRVGNWTQIVPQQLPQIGGVFVPRLSDPSNYETYINQNQSYRRDSFINRGISTEQQNSSHVMQAAVLNGNKFGTGVYLDSTRPQIGRGGRQLFSPDTQGVSRVGPTRKIIIPRESLMVTGMGNVTVYQFHHKHQLYSFNLTQEEQVSNTFLLTFQAQYNPTGIQSQSGYFNTQMTTQPSTSGSAHRKTKRSTQDSQVGYQIQGFTVSDAFQDSWVTDAESFTGAFRASENTRQVHQICLHPGDKFILQDNESGVKPNQQAYYQQTAGIIHYLERQGNTIYLMSETYINQNYVDYVDATGPGGLFCGGLQIGLTQVL